MFVVGASYLSLLQAVAAKCALPYASLLCEAADDGSVLCGIEIELPLLNLQQTYHGNYFSGHAQKQDL
uniref:Uncharacterized protein n=1 Tax=Arundo donax TaxID=35708 RepID=A0A0A8ZNY4_ARUDO